MTLLRRNVLGGMIFTALSVSLTVPVFSESASSLLSRAASQLGTPYRTGGIAPGGFDCSGFVSWLFRPVLPDLPRISRDQARAGTPVPTGEWRPGDLLFYATGRASGRINHVAVYYGDGLIIHSISDGPETGVVITPVESRYWSRRYVSARRVLPRESSQQNLQPPAELADPPMAEESPWNDFEGYLRGDFEAWKAADEEAFEAYKRENG